jgi:exonuclease SbcC
VKLRAIRLTNFRQHAETAIEFAAGITGIIGPNGTGKTTILEAIAWALYGNEAARGRRDSIRFVRADAKAPVRVELEFELSAHRYRVVRGLTSAELYLDGGEQPIANSLTSVSELLQRRIGMTRSEFFNTYFSGQKELSVMTSLGPTERGQFLSRVLGYERLRSAQELARERRRDLLAELNGLRQAMPDPDAVARAVSDATERLADAAQRARAARAAREHAEIRLADIHPRWETAQRDRALQQQMASDLRLAELDLASRSRDVERVAADVAEADGAASELDALAPQLAPLAALARERAALDVLAREEGRRQALAEGVQAGDEELARLVERRARLTDTPTLEREGMLALASKRVELAGAVDALESMRTVWVQDRQEAETKRDALRVQYADIKAQRERIVDAGADGICPTCQRPLGTHYRGVLDVLDAQLEAVKIDGNYYKARVEQLETVPPEITERDAQRRALSLEADALERRVAKLQAGMQELAELQRTIARQEHRLAGMRTDLAALPTGYDAPRHALVRREMERLAPLEQRASQLSALIARATGARAILIAATGARDGAAARTDALRAALTRHGPDDAGFEELRAAHDRARTDVGDAAVALARAEAEATAATESLSRATAARAALAASEARLAELTRERRLHDELDHAYTDLRTDLNFALRPELSKLASAFITDLTDGRYTELDLDDQYNLVIVEDGTPKPVISGGEEDLANLVLRLAISQMIAERAGQAFSLLILDEVFGSLDQGRQKNVIDLLRSLRDRFEQVILITHVETIDFNTADNVLHVRLDTSTGAAVVETTDAPIRVDATLVGAA